MFNPWLPIVKRSRGFIVEKGPLSSNIASCIWTVWRSVASSLNHWLLFPHICWLSCHCDLGYCRLLWNHFGHDRAKNNSGVCFPLSRFNCWFVASTQWLVFGLHWSGNEGLMCMTKLVFLGTTQIELEGWISSPQPLNSTGRECKAWGIV